LKKIRNKAILLILCFSMLSGTMSLGFARAELAPATSPVFSATITVFDHVIADWSPGGAAETTIEIPSNWQVTGVDLTYTAYHDPDDYALRAMAFYLDDRGGGIGCSRIGPGQIRGWTINAGQELTKTFDMSYVKFPRPDTGYYMLDFITGSENFVPGYFSPGVHEVKAFVSTQWHGDVRESWISITLHISYILRIIPAEVEFNPETLNRKSQGKWVTVYIDLPDEYNEEDIDISTIKLNGVSPAEESPTGIDDGILMVKFDRQAFIATHDVGESIEITVTGELFDGTPFEGFDDIRALF